MAFFYSNTFSGVESELRTASDVLNACGRDNFKDGHWYVRFDNESKDRCAENFAAFLNSGMAREIQAETIDKMIAPMAECFGCDENEALALITSPQATMLKEVNGLYAIAERAMEGLQWIQAK